MMTKDKINGLTEEEQNIEVYKEFCESRDKNTVLSGTVIGCLPNTDATRPDQKYFAVVDCGGWQVLIPGTLMGFNIEKQKDKAGNEIPNANKTAMYKAYIKQMLGAKVNFTVYNNPNSINATNKMVIGNRAEAMEKNRESNYFKSDKNGKSKVERAFEADEAVVARVTSIGKSVVWVEVYGQLWEVIAREVSWRYTSDLRQAVHVGDQIHVKFLELEIDKENKEITGSVSIKAAYPNTMRTNMKKYRPGSVLLGTISGIRGDGYFVQVGDHVNGIDVYCKKINCLDIPQEGDSVSVQLYLFDEEKARVFGSIESVVGRKRVNLVG